MLDTTSADLDDGLLHATAGVCNNGYAWVATALNSGLSEYTPEDLQALSAAISSEPPSLHRTKAAKELHDRLDLLVSASVLVHEETHFYQLIATPYGRLRSEIERYWLADLASVTRELAATGEIGPDALPIRAWVERNLDDRSPHHLVARYAEMAYTQTTGLARCLSGSPFIGFLGHAVKDLTIGDGLDQWPGFLCAQDRAEGARDTDDARIQQLTHPSIVTTRLDESAPAVPVVNGQRVTPRAIFEGAAQQIQLDWARKQLGTSPPGPTILRMLNSGFVDHTYLTTRRLVAEQLRNLPWPSRRCVLLTLSDLALWGPTHRDYVGGDDKETLWEDVHPGYRFIRSLDVLAGTYRSPRSCALDDPLAITDLVCSELGWITPMTMASNYLSAAMPDPVRSGMAVDGLHDWRVRAAQARLAQPAVFVDATNEREVHERFNLVIPFLVERGRVRMPDASELWQVLLMATIAHVGDGVFTGKQSYMFDEPANVRDMCHSAALEVLFGDRATEFAPALAGANTTNPTSELGANLATGATDLLGLEDWLEHNGLHEWTRAVKEVRLYHRDEAVDWLLRQPAIVEAMINLTETRPDGTVTIAWPAALGVLTDAAAHSDPSTLTELFEDCGVHWLSEDVFGRSLEELRRSQTPLPDRP